MGDIVSQDRAFTLEILLALLEMYELDWPEQRYAIPMEMESVYSVMFLLITCLGGIIICLGGMRGYEAMWTDLGALRYDGAHCLDRKDELAVSWSIVGRFKAHNGVILTASWCILLGLRDRA